MNIHEVGSISSTIGLVISILTLVFTLFINNEVKKLKTRNLFNQRINGHLKKINELQAALFPLILTIKPNEIAIKDILANLLAEFESIVPKLEDKSAKKKTKKLIKKIKSSNTRIFYDNILEEPNLRDIIIIQFKFHILKMISSHGIKGIYISTNENYNRINQVRLDKKAQI